VLNNYLISQFMKSLKKSSGYTLMEFLIVIAITAIIFAVVFVSSPNLRRSRELSSTAQGMVAVIRNTQNRSITQENGKTWGIRFQNSTSTNHSYIVFKGSSYASGTVETTYFLKSYIQFSDPSAGLSKDVIFSAISGLPQVSTTVKINLVSNSTVSSTININSNGQIQN